MINYNGEKCTLSVEGTPDDVLCELIAIIKATECIYKEKGNVAEFRHKIVESLYNEELTKNAKELLGKGEVNDKSK